MRWKCAVCCIEILVSTTSSDFIFITYQNLLYFNLNYFKTISLHLKFRDICSVPLRHSLLLFRGSPGRLLHSALIPSMSSSDEARRRLRTLSWEQLRGNVPRGKVMLGSSRSVSRERRLVEDCAAGEGGSRSCSIRASVSDCMQLSLDGIRNSFRGTSSLFGCQGKRAKGACLWCVVGPKYRLRMWKEGLTWGFWLH